MSVVIHSEDTREKETQLKHSKSFGHRDNISQYFHLLIAIKL